MRTHEERTAHIDLSGPCVRVTRGIGTKPKRARKALAELTGHTDDEAHICHRCEHGSQNGYCLNPKHFYLGTVTENRHDAYEDDPGLKQRSGAILGQFGHDPASRAKAVRTRRERGSLVKYGEANSNYNRKVTASDRETIGQSTEYAWVLAERYGVTKSLIYSIKKYYKLAHAS